MFANPSEAEVGGLYPSGEGEGVGCKVWGLGFEVYGLGSKVQGLGSGKPGFGLYPSGGQPS